MSLDDWNYENDARVRAGNRSRPDFDEKTMTITFEVEEDCECLECQAKLPPFEVTTVSDGFFEGYEHLRPRFLVVAARDAVWTKTVTVPHGTQEVKQVHPIHPRQYLYGEAASGHAPRAQEVAERLSREAGFTGEMEPDLAHVHKLPAIFEVCPTCEGLGKHVNPSIDAGGLTREDFDEDPDFYEAYRGGVYDVPCYECKGNRVVPVVDEKRLLRENPEVLRMYQERQADDAHFDAISRAERAMGA